MTRTTDIDLLRAALDAADAVLAAREDEMLTTDEWDALEHAVAACSEPPADQRQESFAIEERTLVRRVVPLRGEPYDHRCDQDAYESVAASIDEMNSASFVLEDIRKAANIPWTQAAVAFAFLKERGCVTAVHGRRHAAASGGVYADAMIEWHALREGAPGSA